MTKLGFYGCGNMGSAILTSVLNAGTCKVEEILAVGLDEGKLKIINDRLKVKTSTRPEDLKDCEYVILAFKPQSLPSIIPIPGNNQILISVLAGSTIGNIKKVFKNKKVVRVMPNIPIKYGSGMIGIYFHSPDRITPRLNSRNNISESEKAFITSIFSSGGKTVELKKEEDFDSFTTLCGSGPAYFLYLAEQLSHIAEKNGYSKEQANSMLRQTLIGAADMARHSDLTLKELRRQITSPGGVTEAAVSVLENEDVMKKLFNESIRAGVKRSEEL